MWARRMDGNLEELEKLDRFPPMGPYLVLAGGRGKVGVGVEGGGKSAACPRIETRVLLECGAGGETRQVKT